MGDTGDWRYCQTNTENAMLVFTITVEEVSGEEYLECYDEDGLFYDEEEAVWYSIDEEGTEYWFDEETNDWVECEYEEFVEFTDSDEICYYEE